MRADEFTALSQELLRDYYGEQHYPDGLLAKLWNHVKAASGHEFRRAISQIQDEAGGRAPNIAAILAKLRPILDRARTASRTKQISTLVSDGAGCLSCGGSGWVEALQKPEINPSCTFSFICSACDAAQLRGIKPGNGAIEWYPELEERYLPKYPHMRSLREVDEELKKAGWETEPYRLRLVREERERKERHEHDLQRAQEMEQARPQAIPTSNPQVALPKACPF